MVALGSDLHRAEKGGYRQFLRAQKRLGARAAAVFERTASLLEGALPLKQAVEEKEPAPV